MKIVKAAYRALVGLVAALTALALALCVTLVPAGAIVSHAQIQGSGSTWSQNAVDQWVSDVTPDGLQVVYTGTGSAQGRQDFANFVTDFGVSDIGYLGIDPSTGQSDTSLGRQFAYAPIVAGGTAFPYHILVGGQLVRNLRLSGLTLAKIFTDQITNWDDPAITADNNGHALPSLQIVPVVHSEGAGSTAQFTKWMVAQYPSIWSSFAGYSSFTEYWPTGKGLQIPENGSDNVMNFMTSTAADGAIGYDEYSYPWLQHFPVAKIENKAGYFTLPTEYNVAVALTQAQINYDKNSPDYLLQDLTNVYSYGDPRTYPLSSYSYGIIPTGNASDTPVGKCGALPLSSCKPETRLTTPKRQTLADFLFYSLCQGQAEMGPIGYSPLPINLVEASFDQVALLHTADPGVVLTNENVANCHNPTFVAGQPTRNYLAEVAPQPPTCDKAGQGPCAASVVIYNGNPVNGKPTGAPGSGSPGSGGTPGGGSTTPGSGGTSGSSGTGSGTGSGTTGSQSSSSRSHSALGAVHKASTSANNAASASAAEGTGLADQQQASLNPQLVAASGTGGVSTVALGILAALLLILAVAVPPVASMFFGRRKGSA